MMESVIHLLGSNWKEVETPKRGMGVDFDIDAQGNATDVYLLLEPKKVAPTSSQEEVPSNWNRLDYVLSAFGKKYVTFSGRARRLEFWGVMLFIFLAYTVTFSLAVLIAIFIEDDYLAEEVAGIIFSLSWFALWCITICSCLAVSFRRLQDVGKPGVWALIQFVPIVGFIIFLVFACQDSDADNEYGPHVLSRYFYIFLGSTHAMRAIFYMSEFETLDKLRVRLLLKR